MTEYFGNSTVPVIAIDGPSGAGKGTIGRRLAEQLGFAFLDSGALYRLSALAATHHGISLEDEESISTLAAHLDVQFRSHPENGDGLILLEGEDVSHAIRTEECGLAASKVAALPSVRQALLQRQWAFREAPGLVADGRDMGSVVFPDAPLKVYLTATAEARAQRRYNQLLEKGGTAKIDEILSDITQRDEQDQQRTVAPLRALPDAVLIDTTDMNIDQVIEKLTGLCRDRLGLAI
ncbi:MAG: (d)CMP kinase [Gammaproteobacteria bacterium]|nr:(d)CMP kinase [Gammaproteobacteria bacterium]MCF6231231.1 (d)CMP kinase [Gammaproteobacteria bacterium]